MDDVAVFELGGSQRLVDAQLLEPVAHVVEGAGIGEVGESDGALGRTTRCRCWPWSSRLTRPSIPTASADTASISAMSPGRLAKASDSNVAICAKPLRFRVPLFTDAQAWT